MSRQEVYEKLTEIFADVFDEEEMEISNETTAENIDEWDSLSHITLLSSIEDEFDIKFDMKSIQSLKNVGAMVDMIEALMK